MKIKAYCAIYIFFIICIYVSQHSHADSNYEAVAIEMNPAASHFLFSEGPGDSGIAVVGISHLQINDVNSTISLKISEYNDTHKPGNNDLPAMSFDKSIFQRPVITAKKDIMLGLRYNGSGRFTPSSRVRCLYKYTSLSDSKNWNGEKIGFAPTGLFEIDNESDEIIEKASSFAHRPYIITNHMADGPDRFFLAVLEEIPAILSDSQSTVVQQVYVVSEPPIELNNSGIRDLLYERYGRVPFSFVWDTPMEIVFIGNIGDELSVLTENGWASTCNEARKWTPPHRLIDGQISGVHKDGEIFIVYFQKDGNLYSCTTNDFSRRSKPEKQDLSPKPDMFIDGEGEAKWAGTIVKVSNNKWALEIAHGYEKTSRAWSAWQEVTYFQEEVFLTDFKVSPDSNILYVSTKDTESQDAKVFEIRRKEQTRGEARRHRE